MNVVNAIAKVRFSSAKPQRVGLHKGKGLVAELLCLEPGQSLEVQSGEHGYYVIAGAARIGGKAHPAEVPTGQFAATDEPHTIANPGERRLILLAVSATG